MAKDIANKVALKTIDKAIRAVERKINFYSSKRRNAMLEYAAGDMAEAYQIGAEEAQGEFLARLQALRRSIQQVPPKSMLPQERKCCGTFEGSAHRSSCSGKAKPAHEEGCRCPECDPDFNDPRAQSSGESDANSR